MLQYTSPVKAPADLGVMVATSSAVKALYQVIRHEMPGEIQAARLEVERACREVERSGMNGAVAEDHFQRLAARGHDLFEEARYTHPSTAMWSTTRGSMEANASTARALCQVIRHEMPGEVQTARLEAERARLEAERSGMRAADAEGHFQRLAHQVYPSIQDPEPLEEDEMTRLVRLNPNATRAELHDELIFGPYPHRTYG